MGLKRASRRSFQLAVLLPALAALIALVAQSSAMADKAAPLPTVPLIPGNLLVSTSVYQNDPNIVAGSTQLPPGCTTKCVTATADGSYPYVFNNDAVDGSFGVTSKIVLDQLTPFGFPLGSIEVPNSTDPSATSTSDQMVTSFSSKSEMGLNLSTDGLQLTFMGHKAPVGAVDVSNSNTPGVIDPTNPVHGAYDRVVAQLGLDGKFHFTETNAYSGNNGRSAILNNEPGAGVLYMAGNAGNGGNPQPAGIVVGAGAQIATPPSRPRRHRTPGHPPRWAASASPNSAIRQTRLARTTTSGDRYPQQTSCTTRRAAAATASTPCTSSTRPARRARTALGCPSRVRRFRPPRWPTTPRR